ncbi:MAG: hypothetical protein N2327_04645 [Caldimicrobium sp.]|nr:hypothetical protein [Caldimicrobium sp.]MCX7873700.1 hypothetical protein [Caldimicrobium sp.]MDW8093624.1 hypothetical protein [Caldimicrobium sp.]
MYISRKITPQGYVFSINESYYEAPFYKSRVLLELGLNPGEFVTYYSEVAFSIDLEEKLAKAGKHTDQFELEKLFYPFLKPEAQRWVRLSLNREKRKIVSEKNYEPEDIFWFDRVRLISLKLDHRDPRQIANQRYPFFERLLQKSRDEIENMLWDMEDRLSFREKVRYILSIFSLQRIDSNENRDHVFLDQLCQIAQDPAYFMDLSPHIVLSSYLSRYIWFYFDALPWRATPKIFQFRGNRLYQELATSLNLSVEDLLSLSKKEVLKLFRAKIKELHPDRGGRHESFVSFRRLMEEFLKRRF